MTDTGDAARLVERLRSSADDDVDSVLRTVDRSDPATVDAVLAAMRAIAEDFVVPASELRSHGEDGWTYFDLDELAGYEYPGLISGLLEKEFPTLALPPPEDVLAERLAAAGFDIDDPAARQRFYRGWMAGRASDLLETLAELLQHEDVAFDDRQADLLNALARMDLRGRTRWRLAEVLAAASPHHARQLLETTDAGYLRDALSEALPPRAGGDDASPA